MECDLSLKRLQRETIDFYQMHRPPDHHEWDESFGAMEELRAAPGRSGITGWRWGRWLMG